MELLNLQKNTVRETKFVLLAFATKTPRALRITKNAQFSLSVAL
jgi:hypothetical protein